MSDVKNTIEKKRSYNFKVILVNDDEVVVTGELELMDGELLVVKSTGKEVRVMSNKMIKSGQELKIESFAKGKLYDKIVEGEILTLKTYTQ